MDVVIMLTDRNGFMWTISAYCSGLLYWYWDNCMTSRVLYCYWPVAVVVELVVAGHGDEAAIGHTQGIEDLSTGLQPHLRMNNNNPLYAELHYNDVIMGTIASQITSLTIVYSIVYSDADQRKHQSYASLAFVREFTGIHRGPHKWPITRKMFPFDDVIMFLMKYGNITGMF